MRSERQGSNIRNFASKINLFIFIFGCIWVFLAASGLSLLAVSRGCSRVAVCAVASLVVGHGLCGEQTSVCLFNLYAEYIMRNAGLEEAQTEIKIARRNINNLRYADDTTLMAEKRTKKPLDEG